MPRGVPGPVALKKRPRKANSGSYTKGHNRPGPGRPKGRLNDFTLELRREVLKGLNSAHPEGLAGFVRDAAMETPTAGLSLIGRFIPLSIGGDPNRPVKIEVTIKSRGFEHLASRTLDMSTSP
jgi:hypothetical protein